MAMSYHASAVSTANGENVADESAGQFGLVLKIVLCRLNSFSTENFLKLCATANTKVLLSSYAAEKRTDR